MVGKLKTGTYDEKVGRILGSMLTDEGRQIAREWLQAVSEHKSELDGFPTLKALLEAHAQRPFESFPIAYVTELKGIPCFYLDGVGYMPFDSSDKAHEKCEAYFLDVARKYERGGFFVEEAQALERAGRSADALNVKDLCVMLGLSASEGESSRPHAMSAEEEAVKWFYNGAQ